jgi:hypothetical protein
MRKKISAALALLLAFSLSACACAQGVDDALDGLPGKQWALHPLLRTEVTKVSQITGEDSPNKTQSRFKVWGVDLGSMAVIGDTAYMFGGDTFGNGDNAFWRSNVLFLIRDDDPSDGLTITDAITDKQGSAKELLGSLKQDYVEMTVIPTNLFAVGDTLYCIFMSVSHWGEAGRWDCRYSELARSTDGGKKWEKLNDVRWPGDSNFIQTANCLVGDTMYFWGIPAGRAGGAALMKVPVGELENFESYSYYTGTAQDGSPQWAVGTDGVYRAVTVVDAPVGELSVIYNPYLGNFLMTYLSEPAYAIVMREGITPWGDWGKPYTLAAGAQYPSLYGAFMHPKFMQENGKTFYFAMSQFFPIYNIMWMKAELP